MIIAAACANFLALWCYVAGTKSISDLTTKFTKDTKNPDIFILNLRALRVLRGENLPFYFGCGSAALGPLRLNPPLSIDPPQSNRYSGVTAHSALRATECQTPQASPPTTN